MTLIPQSKFNGGISEDDRIAGATQYLYGEDIDVFTQPDFVQISKGVSTTTTLASQPYNMVVVQTKDASGTKKIIILGDDEIYHEGNNTPVYTNAAMGKLEYPAFVQGNFFYWVQNNGSTAAFTLNRTTLDDAVSTTWTPTMSHATLVADNFYKYSSRLSVGNETYISLGNNIEYLKVDGTTELFDTLVTDEIVGMADTYSGIFIFTDTGKAILWDGATNIIKSSVNLGVRLAGIYQYGTQIFLIAGGLGVKRGLFQFDGATAIRIYEEKFSSQAGEWRFSFEPSEQMITNDRDNFYFVDDKVANARVMFYGNEVTGTEKGLHYVNTKRPNGTDYGNINTILYDEGKLYIGSVTSGVFTVDVTTNNPQTTGFFITNTRDYEVGILRKNNLGLYFRVQDVTVNRTIEVQATYDSSAGGTYTSIFTVNAMPKDGIVRIPKRTFVNAGLAGDFEDISLKFILTTNDTTSPKIVKGFSHDIEVIPVIGN